ncbi:hypothetical protein F5B22DRAFT_625799 [Xylaria bambusicola]|uniref:uncharacterized protein n=1 Tax=Xylaria bambusicola TaxID=326684 RepID=UPI002008A94D|nr:uncharacterized protein F5B22DRAFT_625799 [Xylaria bambusicola]KAI0505999.1 hypothetical protein F5B22DRAFT_625799 [Xylaria bambusicola]
MPSADHTGLLATPCVTCREHHLKCDRGTPRCGRCAHAGRECRLSFKFKPSIGTKFSRDQKWLRPPKRLIYIDETQYLVAGASLDDYASQQHFYTDDGSPGEPKSGSPGTSGLLPGDILGTRRSDVPPTELGHQRKHAPHHGSRDSKLELVRADAQLPTRFETHRNGSDTDSLQTMHPLHRSLSTHTSYDGNVQTSHFYDTPALPLKDPTDAVLFRHYIQKIAISLDCCDPLKHFELIVPERASTCHTLLNAILAIAARHLSHTTDFDPLASNRYHDECLKHLIPMMNHSSAIADENLFAATVILRMLEEMDGSLTGQDNYSHLLGIHVFANAGDQYMLPGSLSAAAFWVGLRQEIYIAILTQQCVKLKLDDFIVDRSLGPADDYTWSNRAIVLLADVLNCCFGDTPLTTQRWIALNEAVESWTRARPPSFNPYFYNNGTGAGAFPEIWHGSSCHILGIQHHILAQLFLIQFDPSIPRVGTKRRGAMRNTTRRIETLMRELCGLGISNQWTPPAMFTACIGIAMFGDHFGEERDQHALSEFLKKTETAHARPTAAIQQQLMKAWGWVEVDG